jgi:hypothetical protein
MTTAERAKAAPKKPVYLLGASFYQGSSTSWMGHDMDGDITLCPTNRSARAAFRMAGYGPHDMQAAEFYD